MLCVQGPAGSRVSLMESGIRITREPPQHYTVHQRNLRPVLTSCLGTFRHCTSPYPWASGLGANCRGAPEPLCLAAGGKGLRFEDFSLDQPRLALESQPLALNLIEHDVEGGHGFGEAAHGEDRTLVKPRVIGQHA